MKIKFKIVPNDKRILKSSKVRAWFREVEKLVAEELKKYPESSLINGLPWEGKYKGMCK